MSFTTKSLNIKDSAIPLKSSKSAILMEVSSGKILYEFNPHEKRSPASMTKVMTMSLVLDAIENKKFTMEDMLTASEYSSSMGGTQIYLEPGEKMKAQDLFKSMVIASANDAAVTLAEKVAGTEEEFAALMNKKAKELGLKNTLFSNATGLPTLNHFTSASDMAIIACDLLKRYENKIIPYTKTYEDYVRKDTDNPFWLVNTNKLLKVNPAIDGLKTGWTNDAGYCITATMKKDGMRLVCVVMGADSPKDRNSDAINILNYGFANYETVKLKDKDTVIESSSDILLNPSNYQVVLSRDAMLLKKKCEKLKDVKEEIMIDYDKIRKLQKENIGTINFYINEKLVESVPLNVKELPKKANFIDLLFTVFKSLF